MVAVQSDYLPKGFMRGGDEDELQVAVTEEMEEEESLKIPAWKKRSRSKSLLDISHITDVACTR